jgi:hypothetical protein
MRVGTPAMETIVEYEKETASPLERAPKFTLRSALHLGLWAPRGLGFEEGASRRL